MRIEPEHSGVQRAEDGAGCDSGIGGEEFAGADAGGDELAEALFVAVAFDKEAFLQMLWDGVRQEMRCGAFHLVEDAMQVEGNHGAEFIGRSRFGAARFFETGNEAVQRTVLAEEEEFVFATEIVVEIGGGEVGGGGDFAHAGFGEAACAEFPAGGAEDFQAAGLVAALQAKGAHGSRMALVRAGVNGK